MPNLKGMVAAPQAVGFSEEMAVRPAVFWGEMEGFLMVFLVEEVFSVKAMGEFPPGVVMGVLQQEDFSARVMAACRAVFLKETVEYLQGEEYLKEMVVFLPAVEQKEMAVFRRALRKE